MSLSLLQFSGQQLPETPVFDPGNFLHLLTRFVFNLLIISIIVRGLYYSVTRRKSYLFSFILISTIVFLICYMLESNTLGFGFALGLFAIFGIIRYRTNPIPIREMTYLFVVIGISVINGLSNINISYLELVFTNLITIAVIYFLEKVWLMKKETWKMVNYEKIELIKPAKRAELIRDLKTRTGLKITRVEIGRINFLTDTVMLKIYYEEDSSIEKDGTETGSHFDDNGD